MLSAATEPSANPDSQHLGGQILYLDFDGVLHHENVLWSHERGVHMQMGPDQHLFAHASLLAHFLEPYPNVRIILSTSWVLLHGFEEAAAQLLPSLRSRVIGSTFQSTMHKDDFRQLRRWQQISQDCARRCPVAWIALDDDFEGWPEALLDNYVRTDPVEGICTPSVMADLQDKLRRHFGRLS